MAYSAERAEHRIRPYTKTTPIEKLIVDGHPAFLKMENRQYTGSFKARGSLNKLLVLREKGFTEGVISASTGNHALGIARALEITGLKGRIVLPRDTKVAKRKRLEKAGVPLVFVDGGPLQAELAAKEMAAESGEIWVSPYNDADVIAGQGTIAIELFEQLPELERLFVTVGGGGLISGVASVLKYRLPGAKVIGCVPQNSPEMMLSVAAGKIIHQKNRLPTLSDGSAGGAEDDAITLAFCAQLVDEWMAVSEEEIAGGMREIEAHAGDRVEGSAGVAFAAWKKSSDKSVCDAVIMCGGNIERTDFLAAIR